MTVRPARVWRHLPWGRMPVWLQYTPWRVSCSPVRGGARSWLGTVDAARLRQIYRQFGADPAKANEMRTGAGVRPPWATRSGNHTAAGWQTTIGSLRRRRAAGTPHLLTAAGPRAPPPASDNLRRVRT